MITTGTRSAQQLEDAKELEGMRVFVVEDEGLVAMSVEDMLSDLGYKVAAQASSLPSTSRYSRSAWNG